VRIDDTTDGGNIDATLNRSFGASAEIVFRQWITVEGLQAWFAPDGFDVTLAETEPVVDGRWQVEMRSAGGEVHLEYGNYRDIVPAQRLVFTLTQGHDAEIGPRTTVSVDFIDTDGRTQMAFLQQGFDTVERRDANLEGWSECFNKLEALLAPV
jgi:uncharacterized protein YndB with AHSA1/START domain